MPLYERHDYEFPPGTQRDINTFFFGKYLGAGVNREVFADALNPRRVYKIEAHGVQNWTEYQVWFAVKGTPWERWFAPCFLLSAYGRILIQARTKHPVVGRAAPSFPTDVPDFMTDVKADNMGIYQGRWVFHDYGYTHLLERGLIASREMPWPDNHTVPTPRVGTKWELP